MRTLALCERVFDFVTIQKLVERARAHRRAVILSSADRKQPQFLIRNLRVRGYTGERLIEFGGPQSGAEEELEMIQPDRERLAPPAGCDPKKCGSAIR